MRHGTITNSFIIILQHRFSLFEMIFIFQQTSLMLNALFISLLSKPFSQKEKSSQLIRISNEQLN